VWKVKVPNKVGHFVWRLVRDKLPTGRNLNLRQITVGDLNYICPLCLRVEESVDHLFFSCERVREIWLECYSWIGFSSGVQVVPREHFLQHWYCESGRIDGQRQMVLWAAVTWCIWRHRNKYIFNNQEFRGETVLDDAMFFIWSWLNALEKGFNVPFQVWSSNIRMNFVRG